jgi:hypothetical protein
VQKVIDATREDGPVIDEYTENYCPQKNKRNDDGSTKKTTHEATPKAWLEFSI